MSKLKLAPASETAAAKAPAMDSLGAGFFGALPFAIDGLTGRTRATKYVVGGKNACFMRRRDWRDMSDSNIRPCPICYQPGQTYASECHCSPDAKLSMPPQPVSEWKGEGLSKPFWINFWNRKEYPLVDNCALQVMVTTEPRGKESFMVLEATPARRAAEEMLELLRDAHRALRMFTKGDEPLLAEIAAAIKKAGG